MPQEAERKRKKSHKDTKRKAFKEYMGAMWLIITALYFLISFATRAWHITRVIFIIGVAVKQCIRAIFYMEGEQSGMNCEKCKKNLYECILDVYCDNIFCVELCNTCVGSYMDNFPYRRDDKFDYTNKG